MTERSFVTVANPGRPIGPAGPDGAGLVDINIEVAVQGSGPLVVFVHGWPETWHSWRHQVAHLADRYTTAAISVRGYANSSNPTQVEAYTLRELSSDVAAVVDALGDGPAILVGHDWGAPIVWNTARLHPDKVAAVCGLSVPYVPVSADSTIDGYRARYQADDRFFYQLYIVDNVGGAEAELGADHEKSLRMIWYSACGEARGAGLTARKPASATMLEGMIDPDPFPSWSTPADLAIYAEAFATSGWHGPLHRYRAQPLDNADLGALPHPEIHQPAAFIGGEHDPVRGFAPGIDLFQYASAACTDFRGTTIVEGAGHWVQQEAPAATNAALDAFLATLT